MKTCVVILLLKVLHRRHRLSTSDEKMCKLYCTNWGRTILNQLVMDSSMPVPSCSVTGNETTLDTKLIQLGAKRVSQRNSESPLVDLKCSSKRFNQFPPCTIWGLKKVCMSFHGENLTFQRRSGASSTMQLKRICLLYYSPLARYLVLQMLVSRLLGNGVRYCAPCSLYSANGISLSQQLR